MGSSKIDGRLFVMFRPELASSGYSKNHAKFVLSSSIGRMYVPTFMQDWGWCRFGFSDPSDHRMIVEACGKNESGALRISTTNRRLVIYNRPLYEKIAAIAGVDTKHMSCNEPTGWRVKWDTAESGPRWVEFDLEKAQKQQTGRYARRKKGPIGKDAEDGDRGEKRGDDGAGAGSPDGLIKG